MAPPHLSLIIPAFNEARRLPLTLRGLADYVQAREDLVEIVLVDDGSSDATAAVARALGEELQLELRVVEHGRNRGKGRAVATGVAAARGDSVLFLDADLSYPCEAIGEALALLAASGADVVIGDRSLSAPAERRPGFLRWAAGEAYARMVSKTLLNGISDSQCGFKLFDAAVARELFSKLTVDGFGFDVEILYLAQRRGLHVARMPVVAIHRDGTTVSLARDSARMFVDLFKIRLNDVRGRYDS